MNDDGAGKKSGDRDLLFGVIAVELGLLDPAGLMEGAAAWAATRDRGLGEVLAERGLLTLDRVGLVEQMVELRLAQARAGEDSSSTLTGDPGGEGADGTLPSFGGELLFPAPMRSGPTPGEVIAESGQVTHEHPGRYTIKGERGRGAIGRVMIAFDEHVGREVALKELLPDHSAFPAGSTPSRSPSRVTAAATSRFLREARITGQLEHPSIVPVYEIGRRDDGSTYYTMRLVGGRTMADRLRECRSLAERLRLLPNYLDLCQAMAYAHSKDVIHRDLKPANIMLGGFGETVVLDWGLAKVRGLADIRADDMERSLKLIQEASAGETVKGVPIGTPSYMSPEQAEGRLDAVDERSDVWSLGAILYEVLTGHTPFVGETAWEVMGRVIKDEVAPAGAEDPAVPAELAAIAAKCLTKDPAARYQDAAELAEDVAKFQSGGLVSAYEYSMTALVGRWVKKRWPVVATAGVALAVLAVFGVWSVRNINKQKDRAVSNERVALSQKVAAEQNLQLAETREREARRNLAESFLVMGRLLESRMAWRSAELYYAASVRLHDGLVGRYSINYVRTRPELAGTYVRTFAGHTDEVWTVAWSPDGKLLASASEDHTVKVWEVATGQLRHDLTGHTAKIWTALFSPDGKLIASASADNTVRLWDSATGALITVLDGHSASAAGLAFAPDGSGLAVGSWDHTVTYWSVPAGVLLHRFEEATNPVAISPDGKTLAAATLVNNVKLFDLESAALIHVLEGHQDPVYTLAFSPDGRTLATAGGNVLSPTADNSVRLWDTATGQLVKTLAGHALEVRSLAFDPGGELLASASADETVKLWNVFTGRLLRTLSGHSSGVFWAEFTPDGNYLATASGDMSVKLWQPRTGDLLATLEGHTNRVNSLAIDPDGLLMASAGADGAVKLWSIMPQSDTIVLPGHQDSVSRALFRPDGTVIATASGNIYAGSKDNTIKFWNTTTGDLLLSTDYHQAQVCDLAWGPDGNLFASTDTDGVLQILNIEAEQLTTVSDAHEDYALSLAFSPDGKVLATAGGNVYQTGTDNSIKLWDPQTGDLIRKLDGHLESIFALEWSPDGKLLASASANLFAESKDNTVKIWDPATGALLHTLEGHRESVFHIAFSPDGKLLASCGGDVFSKGNDNAVRLWDPVAGKPALVLEGHTRAVFDCEFTPDGKHLVTSSDDGTVKVWDVASGALVRSIEGFKGGVEDAAVSPDGKIIVAGAGDKTVKLHGFDGELLHSLVGHSGYVRDLAFSPDGRTLATASDDQTVILWRFDPRTLEGDPEALLGEAEQNSGLKLVGTKLHPWDPATGKISATAASQGL